MADKNQKVFYRPEFYLILSTLLGSAALTVSSFGSNLYRDVAYCYAYAIREAALYGTWDYVLDPGLPIFSMLTSVPFALCGLEASHALMLTCGIFWIATIFPLYFLLKRFISPIAASVGTLLFILAPKLLRFSCAGMPEAPRNFFLVLAFLMLFKLLERKSFQNIFFFALSLAGLATARSEGFAISVAFILLVLGNEIWLMRRYFSLKGLLRPILLCSAVVALFLLFLSPKLIYNYEKTGYPTIDTRYNPYLNILHFDRFTNLPEDYPPPRSIAESAAAYKDSATFPWKKNLKAALTNTFRGAYELYFALGLIGLFGCIFHFSRIYKHTQQEIPEIVQKGWRIEYTDALIIILLHEILYFSDCSAYRYYTFLLPLMLPFTMLALSCIWNTAKFLPYRRYSCAFLILAGCAIAITQLGNGLDFTFRNAEEREAGLFLQKHSGDFRKGENKRLRIYTGYPEIAYYSGFEYTNSSLNSKSKKLTAKENEFDLAIFEQKNKKWEFFAKKYNLVEWTAHPYSKFMRILIPKQKTGVP